MSPPASLFGSTLHGSNSNTSFASDEDETKYLKRTHILSRARIGVAAALVIFALVGLGCEGHVADHYLKTNRYADVNLPLWPQELEFGPSVAFIVCDCLVLIVATAYLLLALVPSPHPRTSILNYLSIASGLLGVTTSAISFIIFIVRNNPHETNGVFLGETIHSWTCTWGRSLFHEYTDREAAPEKIEAVDGFDRLCAETTTSIVSTAILLALSLAFAMLGSHAFYMQRDMAFKRKRNAATEQAVRGSQEEFAQKEGSVVTSSTAV